MFIIGHCQLLLYILIRYNQVHSDNPIPIIWRSYRGAIGNISQLFNIAICAILENDEVLFGRK